MKQYFIGIDRANNGWRLVVSEGSANRMEKCEIGSFIAIELSTGLQDCAKVIVEHDKNEKQKV